MKTIARPAWAETNELMRQYYDTEWGMPVRDTPGVYERIVLESFQGGLSWETILRRRPAFRSAFKGFAPEKVARFGPKSVERLLADQGIIRNRRKIEAAITNARATVALGERGVELGELVWSFRPDDPTAVSEVTPSSSAESAALSRELKGHGFVLVGPVTMYALMEAIGILEHRL